MRFLPWLMLFFTLPAFADTAGYAIRIDDNGYKLTIEMSFPATVSLGRIRQTLKNPVVLSQLSPHVKSVTNAPLDSVRYESLMVTKSFGISSELVSKCEEESSKTTWSRACQLQTNRGDGGRYMEWKKDVVSCQQREDRTKVCAFLIQGKAKPLTLLGLQLLDAKRFSVKAKFEALNNFFKLYFYISDGSLSARRALKLFEQSPISQQLEDFSEKANQVLKTEAAYETSYRFGG